MFTIRWKSSLIQFNQNEKMSYIKFVQGRTSTQRVSIYWKSIKVGTTVAWANKFKLIKPCWVCSVAFINFLFVSRLCTVTGKTSETCKENIIHIKKSKIVCATHW